MRGGGQADAGGVSWKLDRTLLLIQRPLSCPALRGKLYLLYAHCNVCLTNMSNICRIERLQQQSAVCGISFISMWVGVDNMVNGKLVSVIPPEFLCV